MSRIFVDTNVPMYAAGREHRFKDAAQRTLMAIDENTLLQLTRLEGMRPRLSARDLVHVACMRQHGIDRILSFDQDFDGLPGIGRLAPDAPG